MQRAEDRHFMVQIAMKCVAVRHISRDLLKRVDPIYLAKFRYLFQLFYLNIKKGGRWLLSGNYVQSEYTRETRNKKAHLSIISTVFAALDLMIGDLHALTTFPFG